jgi:hemerythrin-like metal-binding protein
LPELLEEHEMKWDDSFAIGIEAIDNQHKKIFEHLLALENSVIKRDPWHILRFFVAQLSEYMQFHLAVEEALLEIVGYPDRSAHGDSHAKLVAQIASLEEKLKTNANGESLVGFFEDWFIRHVLSSDRDYASFVKREFASLAARRAA